MLTYADSMEAWYSSKELWGLCVCVCVCICICMYVIYICMYVYIYIKFTCFISTGVQILTLMRLTVWRPGILSRRCGTCRNAGTSN
jgi:hypothetical protein